MVCVVVVVGKLGLSRGTVCLCLDGVVETLYDCLFD